MEASEPFRHQSDTAQLEFGGRSEGCVDHSDSPHSRGNSGSDPARSSPPVAISPQTNPLSGTVALVTSALLPEPECCGLTAVEDPTSWNALDFDAASVSPDNSLAMASQVSLLWIIGDETALASVMLANNEVGAIEPVAELAKYCRASGVPLHTDAAQALGKIPVDVRALGVDFLSVAGHKLYAPKGIGAPCGSSCHRTH